jgi:hypothetical protein
MARGRCVIKCFLTGMKERGRGNVITMSSAAARRPNPGSPIAYAAAKAGIELLTKDVAAQAGPHGVRVNCIAPETIMTETNQQQIPEQVRETLRDTHPIRRLGTPEDVAQTALFLASDNSAWISGIVVDVAGGSVLVEHPATPIMPKPHHPAIARRSPVNSLRRPVVDDPRIERECVTPEFGQSRPYPAMAAAQIRRVGPTQEKRTFHSFRHTFAKRALESGTQITWLSRHLGHSSLKVTTDIYGHWERAERKLQAAKTEDAFPV